MWGKFTDDNTSFYRICLCCFCSMLNTLLSNDFKDDTEYQNIYNMEGFLDFRDFEAYAYVS